MIGCGIDGAARARCAAGAQGRAASARRTAVTGDRPVDRRIRRGAAGSRGAALSGRSTRAKHGRGSAASYRAAIAQISVRGLAAAAAARTDDQAHCEESDA